MAENKVVKIDNTQWHLLTTANVNKFTLQNQSERDNIHIAATSDETYPDDNQDECIVVKPLERILETAIGDFFLGAVTPHRIWAKSTGNLCKTCVFISYN